MQSKALKLINAADVPVALRECGQREKMDVSSTLWRQVALRGGRMLQSKAVCP